MARLWLVTLCSLLCLAPAPAAAQLCGDKPDMLIVLDRSGSMASGSPSKWAQAKAAVNTVVSANAGKIRFGLLMFPYPNYCSVTGVQVAVGDYTAAAISGTLNGSAATGSNTPIAAALQSAYSYLVSVDPGKPKYVLLITDGSENCSGNPVSAVSTLLGAKIKTFVVGFGTGVSSSQLNSMAQAGGTALSGGTKYYQANNQSQLSAALKTIAGQVNCCGNGKLDAGEACDTAIAPGTWGACPTYCNDNNACTTDALGGSQCKVKCSYTPITQPAHGDGCCPPGASSINDSDCKIVCGNGLLEAGEQCDPGIAAGPGKCVTLAACNDGNPCTLDNVAGSPCQRVCTYKALGPNTVVKDGCCPPGASSKTDLDCSTVCGNGLLEAGETCDPGIVAGAGKCPTLAACNDGNACTKDTLAGSACNLKCKNTPVAPNAKVKDGCCPAGANAITDADCAPICGNGVLEAGETCDPKIVSGAGKCPSLKDCDDKNSCTKDGLTGSGCNVKCTHTKLTANPTKKDGCCPKGATSLTDKDCAPVCGNGVLEAGEQCDPGITSGAGKCKTLKDCDDGNACTKDVLAGSGCSVSCKHSKLTASKSKKDGCCPAGASSLTDADCPAGCGNGILEAGETCDPKITSGKGKCPTLKDCDDLDPCTVDTLSGGACTLKCKNALIAANPTKKDGCCPSGANSLTDKDCLPVCGNGLLEAGESCDTGITSGPGKCKTLADCDDKDKCTIDTLLGSGCASKCVNTPVAPDPKYKDGCCPPGHTQKTDADCLPPCGPDKTTGCIDLCKGVTCPAGYYCKNGKCYKGNTKAGDGGVTGYTEAGLPIKGDGGVTKYDEAGKPIPADGGKVKYTEAGKPIPGGEAGAVHTEAGGPGTGNPGSGGPAEAGCACQTTSGAGGLPWLLLGLLLLGLRRRRP